MKSDIEIAQSAKILAISKIAEKYGILEDELEHYGKYKAKVSLDIFKRFYNRSLNSNFLLDVLPDAVEIDINKEYLLYTPVLISILDIFLQETLLQEKSNRFY